MPRNAVLNTRGDSSSLRRIVNEVVKGKLELFYPPVLNDVLTWSWTELKSGAIDDTGRLAKTCKMPQDSLLLVSSSSSSLLLLILIHLGRLE